MKFTIPLTILGVILLIVGSVVITHSATVVVVKNKDNKKYSSKHWGYIALGAVCVLIGIFIIFKIVIGYFKDFGGGKQKGSVFLETPPKFANWIKGNVGTDGLFHKKLGEFVDANYKRSKNILKDVYVKYAISAGDDIVMKQE